MSKVTNCHQKMLEIFPWINNINREFSKSFPSDYQEYSLDLLIKKIEKELKEISSCPLSKRTKYLYEVLGYFYTHFCLKVKWNKSSQHMQAVCVQILSNLIRVGLLLSDGNIESPWLNRILAAIRIFSGPPDHLYTALLCVNVLKKRYLKTYSIILKNILCYDQNTTKEPIEYLKVILLFRRLKALVKKVPVWNAEISLAVAKVKAPASLKSWLRSHNFEMLWDVKSKMILNKLMRKSLDKAILRRLQEVIVPEMCLKKTSFNRQLSPGASDSFVIDSSNESRMILTEYNGSSEVAPSTVKKLIKKRKLNCNAIGQGNIQATNVEKGDEILVANAHEGNKRKKAQEKKSSLIDNIQIKSNVQESTVLEVDYSGTKTSDMKNKKKRKRKQRSVKKSAGSIRGIKTMNQTDSNDTSQPSKNNIGKIKEKYDLYDIKEDSIERKLSGEKICISNSRKLINGSDKYESLDEISLQKGSPQQTQTAEKTALLSETVNCSPSVVGKEFKNVIVVKDLLDNEDTLNLQKELKGEIVENCERKDEAVEEIDKPILESVESQHSSILPVLEASSEKGLSNYIGNVTDGDINDLSYNKNTSGLSLESMNKITEDIELKDDVIDKPILESVGIQHSLTIPVLETISKNTSDLQIELKDETIENFDREEEVINKVILESVGQQHSLTIPVLDTSCKNTSDLPIESNKITEDIELKDDVIDKPILESVGVQHNSTIPVLETSSKNTSDFQIELKDETIENFDREEEVINEVILESVGQQHSLTIPVLETSCKNTSDLPIESNKITEDIELKDDVIDKPILESVGVQHNSTIPVLGTSSKNTSDLQIELKDEVIENFDREEEVIDEAFLESVGLQHRLTVPVVEASSKKGFLKDDDSNKLISVKQSEIKSVHYSIEMNKSGSSIAESNSKGIIEDCSLKNTELDPQSSNLIIVENSSKNQAEIFPNDTVDYIMGKMRKHLEQADHSVKECSFETLKHNTLKSGIKITPNKSLSVTNDSNLESSPLLKKASNQLSFLDLSLEKSSPSKTKNTRHHVSKVTEFSFYRDFDHDLEDMKSEDSLSGSQITDKMDVKEFSSDDCSNDSDVSEINESTQVSQLGDVCKIYNSGDLPNTFHGKNDFSDSSEQSFISRNSKEKEVENETNFQMHKIDVLEKDIESISPNIDSCVESKKYKRLSLSVNLGERCEGGDINENKSKILNSCINSAAEFDFDDNNNSYGPENLMLQGNQIQGCDLHENKKEVIDKKSPYVVLSDCVKKPFDSKIDIPKSPLHLTDSHIEMSFSSVCESISFTKSENQVKSQDQVDSCSSDLVEHDSITEPSLGMKLRKRTNHTASIGKSAPVVEEVHVKSAPVVEEVHVKSAPVVEEVRVKSAPVVKEVHVKSPVVKEVHVKSPVVKEVHVKSPVVQVHVKSCDTKQVETPIKLACRTSLRNRNFSRSCKSLGKGGIKSPSSKSSSVGHSSKKLKKEGNQNLGFDFSVLSLDSPKTRSCRLRESSIKNIPEEQKDSVVMESETLSNSVFLNEEKKKVCQKSSGSLTAASIEVDDSQESNNQGYNLRSRKCIILPGKLKLEKKS